MTELPNTAEEWAAGVTLLLDKPLEWTSFQVVGMVKHNLRRSLKAKVKVGHAGTLDPKATGLLVVCTGRHTKRISEIQDAEKEYAGVIRIGSTRPSYDLETEIDAHFATAEVTDELIRAAALSLTGKMEQTAPIYSAKKVDGNRAYDLARKGKEVALRPHNVTVSAFEITAIERDDAGIDAHFRIVCSKGTYIRTLAFDLGNRLSNGAHLIALRRTRIGTLCVDDAWLVDDFRDKVRGADKGADL
jgi:tRNA pseudouridine55 synthase